MQLSLLASAPQRGLTRRVRPGRLRSTFLLFLGLLTHFCLAQAPSHDPTGIVRNTDGRYWIFTTGDGIWAMSASNPDFTDWRPEPTPFRPGTWPSWINSAVPGFAGAFWAPGIIQMNGYYYLYYSVSTFGSSRSAIGVTRATNLAGPWTDLGMVVSSNGSRSAINAIDAALLRDDDGRVYMSYGSFFGGLAVVEINPGTGKTTGSVTWIAGGNHQDREAPYIMKNGGYYYLFSNRGSCCNGSNSSYYVVVSRATNIRGPYTDERTFLPVRNGNIIGPGHIGYGHGRLTYHYYDGADGGRAKLMTRADFGFSNGWPYLGTPPSGGGSGTVYQLRNRGTGLYLDGMGSTTNGSAVAQYANTSHPNAQWEAINVGDGYVQLRNRGTGLFLDGYGRTENGAEVAQYANTTHPNSHWRLQAYSGNYYRLQNRGTGIYLDGMGRTANGDACGQWANTTHPNAQWELVGVSSLRMAETAERVSPGQDRLTESVATFPNPVRETLHIQLGDDRATGPARLYSLAGRLVTEKGLTYGSSRIDVSAFPSGVYILEVPLASGMKRTKIIKD